jgi:eukaryotic-like serine/threonine-protein kinase
MSLLAGTRVNQYEIIGQLGVRGMGEVYRARDTRLHRDVAIKVLPPVFAAQIYGVEETASAFALVIGLVQGPSVADLIARPGELALGDALDIARQIAESLEAAHDNGIIHRDRPDKRGAARSCNRARAGPMTYTIAGARRIGVLPVRQSWCCAA